MKIFKYKLSTGTFYSSDYEPNCEVFHNEMEMICLQLIERVNSNSQ